LTRNGKLPTHREEYYDAQKLFSRDCLIADPWIGKRRRTAKWWPKHNDAWSASSYSEEKYIPTPNPEMFDLKFQ